MPPKSYFPCWKYPKTTCWVFFFFLLLWERLTELECAEPTSPFKFTYKRELTLVPKCALQNAQGTHSCLPHTQPDLRRSLPPPESQVSSRVMLNPIGRPVAPVVTQRMQEQRKGSLLRWLKTRAAGYWAGRAFSFCLGFITSAPPHSCGPGAEEGMLQ